MKRVFAESDLVKVSPGTRYVRRIGYRYCPAEVRWMFYSLVDGLHPSFVTQKKSRYKLRALESRVAIEGLTKDLVFATIPDQIVAGAAWKFWSLSRAIFTALAEHEKVAKDSRSGDSWKDEQNEWARTERFNIYLGGFLETIFHEVFQSHILPHMGNKREIHYGTVIDHSQWYSILNIRRKQIGAVYEEYGEESHDGSWRYFDQERTVKLATVTSLAKILLHCRQRSWSVFDWDNVSSGICDRWSAFKWDFPVEDPKDWAKNFEIALESYYLRDFFLLDLVSAEHHTTAAFEDPSVTPRKRRTGIFN